MLKGKGEDTEARRVFWSLVPYGESSLVFSLESQAWGQVEHSHLKNLYCVCLTFSSPPYASCLGILVFLALLVLCPLGALRGLKASNPVSVLLAKLQHMTAFRFRPICSRKEAMANGLF
jgi:hypothetical protein